MAIKLRRLLPTFELQYAPLYYKMPFTPCGPFTPLVFCLTGSSPYGRNGYVNIVVGIFILVATTQIKLSRKVPMPNTLILIRFDCNKNDSRRIFLLTSGLWTRRLAESDSDVYRKLLAVCAFHDLILPPLSAFFTEKKLRKQQKSPQKRAFLLF